MKYDINTLKRKMLVKYPFFGSVVSDVDYKEDKNISAAATDGKTIYYNPEFLEDLSVSEQTFIFAHEVCHIAFNHVLRSEGKDPELWNIATDAVINQFLKRDGLEMVQGGVDMAEAINYDAEELYEKLLKEKQQNKQGDNQQNKQSNEQQSQSQSGSKSGNGTQPQEQSGDNSKIQEQSNNEQKSQPHDKSSENNSKEQNNNGFEDTQQEKSQSSKKNVGHDTHNMWEQAVKEHKEQQEKTDKKESLLDKLLGKDKDKKDKEKTELKKKQEELESMGEKDAFKQNLDDKKRQLEDLKEEISNQAAKAGTITNGDIRIVNNIGTAKPLIDWRYILREAIKYDADWSYKNATVEDGVVVANLEELPMPETEIVLDTSCSINETLLKNFLRECKNILHHSKLKVGCFDTRFYGFHEIKTEKDIENMQFEGGGDTDFNAAVGAFSRRVENKIIFTDGEAPMPNMPLNAIWIVFGREKISPKGGKVIHITPEQLDMLCSYEMNTQTRGRAR